jgi:hypothetical protein
MANPQKAKSATPTLTADPVYHCEFCKKDFRRENSLINHMCEKKRRWFAKDEKPYRIGFMAYLRFYELSLRSKKPRTYQQFMDSPYFMSFIKFGRYLEHINAIEVQGFTEFLIKGNVKLDDWVQDMWYESWVRELAKKESADKAIERNILLMEQWGRETGEPWVDFFRKVSTPRAVEYIRKGRISPWLLYCGVGQSLFDRMSDEQLGLVKEWINPMYWIAKIRDNRYDVEIIRGILAEAGV